MFHNVWTDDMILERFQYVVANNKNHPFKKHCEEVAKFWYKIVTGLEQGCFVVSYRTSLSDGQKKQRARLHIPESPAILNKIRITMDEVNRCDDMLEDFGMNDNEKKVLVEALKEYCGEDSVDDFLDEEHENYNLSDPNSFLINDFYPFDPKTEKPKPFPRIIHTCKPRKISKEHKDGEKETHFNEDHPFWRDYHYHNKNLVYLIYEHQQPILCIDNQKEVYETTATYYCYAAGKSWKLTKIPDKVALNDDELIRESRDVAMSTSAEMVTLEPSTNHRDFAEIEAEPRTRSLTYNADNSNGAKARYLLEMWVSDIDQIPARQFGWYKDPVTRGETFESPLFPVKGHFIDLMQTKGELAVVKATQGFSRRYQYVPKCTHRSPVTKKVCNLGQLDGKECGKCKGTGKKRFISAPEDMITFEMTMDDPPRPDKLIALEKLAFSEEIPKEAINLIRDCFREAKEQIYECMFSTSIYENGQIVNKTATEIQHNKGPINNFLSRIGKAKARMAKFIVETSSAYMDFKCEYSRRYPSNFKLHSVSELLTMRKQAIDSGAPAHIINSIDRDIMQKQNRDNVELQNQIKIRELFRPFSELTPNEKVFALGQLSATDEKKILYLCFDEIFNEIDHNPKYSGFYKQKYDKQKTTIDELIQEHKERISENKEEAQVAAFGEFPLNEDDEEAEPQ